MRVLKTLQSPRGFTVLPIHYSHDPEKSARWAMEEQAKYRKDYGDWEGTWNREMELDFTSVPGSIAYPNFSDLNLKKDLPYNLSLPLCIDCDFNVEPMIWEVSQRIVDDLYVIDEIKIGNNATVEGMVREFRNRYPAHPAELWIYGDATGNKRGQTASSDYDLLRLCLRGYPSSRVFKVPVANPPVKDRLNAVNLKLKNGEGVVGVYINPVKCPELVKDLREVIAKDGQIVKTSKREDPYFDRTHASDGFGYHIFREWPVVSQVYQHARKKRLPMKQKYRGIGGL